MEKVIQTMCSPAPFSSGKAPGFLSRLLQEKVNSTERKLCWCDIKTIFRLKHLLKDILVCALAT